MKKLNRKLEKFFERDAKISVIFFDDELEIETTAAALTKVKTEFNYKIRKVGEEKILVEGFSRNVFTDLKTGKIIRLPEKYLAKLEKAEP